MNKLFLKVGAIVLGAGLVVGSGVAIAAHKESFKAASAAEVVAYTLDGSTATGSSDDGAYNVAHAITQDGISWGLMLNANISPWRLGGKKSNGTSATATDRTLTSKAAVSSENISKVVVNATNPASNNIEVSAVKLYVGESEGDNSTSDLSMSYSSGNMTFERPAGKNWSSKFFTIAFSVINNTTTQKYVFVNSITFYYTVETVAPDTVTVSGASSVSVGSTITLTASATKSGSTTGVNQNVNWSSLDEGKAIVSDSGVVTGISNGNVTIRATSEDDNTIYGDKVITVNNGKTDDSALVLDSTSGFEATYGNRYLAVDGVYYHYSQVQSNSTNDYLQFQASSGLFENVAAYPADISVIELTISSESNGQNYKVLASTDGSTYNELSAQILYSGTEYYVPTAGSRYFRITAGTQTLRLSEILVGFSNTVEEKMLTLVSSLNTLLDAECSGEEDNTPLTAAKWEEIAGVYASGDADAKTALAGVTGRSYLRVNHFLERYDYVVTAYGYTNFLNRTLSSHRTISLVGNNNVVLIAIIASSLTVISAVALVFVLKRKKHN